MKTLIIFIFCVTCAFVFGDPQDDADTACSSSLQPAVLTDTTADITTSIGTIESDNFPDGYDPNSFCTWYIAPLDVPDGYHIYFELESFDVESWDDLKFYDGNSVFGDFLFELTGNLNGGTVYSTQASEMFLTFYSDYIYQYKGFRIHYKLQETGPAQEQSALACSYDTMPVNIMNETGLIESLNYPDSYPASTPCQWYINPSMDAGGLYLSIIDFYTYDYLYIYEGNNNDGIALAYWYGYPDLSTGTTVYTSGNELFIDFPYPYYNVYRGFQITFFPADEACLSGGGVQIQIPDGETDSDGDGVPDDQAGVVQSPGYPYTTPEHLSCRWLITAPPGHKVMLMSQIIRLAYDADCSDEYVEIIDGPNVNDLSLGKFCGNATFGSIPSTGDSIQIYLKTAANTFYNTIGFSILYDVEDSAHIPN